MLPCARTAQNEDAAKMTMPLDGLKEMFEYARNGDDWGHTSVILPPSQATEPNDAPLDPMPLDAPSAIDTGVVAFDGWSGTASFP
jgi:hypothetical protein